jgi:hypothetical protein
VCRPADARRDPPASIGGRATRGDLGRCVVRDHVVVARIDPFDESLDRWVVEHYAFDPERHERWNRPVVAFDHPDEMVAFIESAAAELKRRQRQGLADEREQYSGRRREPGYEKASQRDRIAVRMNRRRGTSSG